MCRVWAHLGDPLLIDGPLFGAENSLIAQSVSPSLMSLLNIGGFGLLAWDAGSRTPEEPYAYRTPNVPVFDRNLKALAAKVHANAAVAHVRGVVYDPSERVGPQNLHPFRFPGARIALAQNVRGKGEVDALLAEAEKAGGRIIAKAEDKFWGGYSGYFADPDGHPWEVAWNPGFTLTEDGRLVVPE